MSGQPVLDARPARRPRQQPALRHVLRRHSVLLACLATLLVHLLWLTRHLTPDEGGFAMVAQHWHEAGRYLYGPEWVDRPPGLIALFAAAGHLGLYGIRLTAALVAVALVAAVAWAADAVGGRPAARWSAWLAFALASSALLDAQALNGELSAATLVALSVAALLRALRVSTSRTRTLVYGGVAGVAASLAVLMKQNFLDAFVFAGVLLTLGVATRANRLTYRPARVMATAGAFSAGAVLPLAAALSWAARHGGVHALLYATFGFRVDAAAVMSRWSWSAPLQRLAVLVVFGVLSGLLALLVHLAVGHRRRLRRLDPLPWAVAAAAAVEVAGILGGANFWAHYLIALVPMVSLAAGLSVNRRTSGWRWTRRLVLLSVVVTAVVSPVAAVVAARTPSEAFTTGRWLAASAHPGDSLVVPFTHANVLQASGLEPGYPYAWSLPLRTLDPRLSLLTRRLDSPSAPTWVVRWDSAHAWGLDPADHVDGALRAHYHQVAVVCGHPVWLHKGRSREPARTPSPAACGSGLA